MASILMCVLLPSIIAIGIITTSAVYEQSTMLIASGLVLTASVYIMQRSVGVLHLRQMTIPGFWYLTYLITIFVPSFFVFLHHSGTARYMYLIAVHSALLTVPLGIVWVNCLARFNRSEIRRYFQRALEDKYVDSSRFSVLIICVFASLGILSLYLSEVKTLPLFHMLRNPGDYQTLMQLREDSFKLLDSPFVYFYFLLRSVGFPCLILLTLGYYMRTGEHRWAVLLVITTFSGLVYAASSLAKGPVIGIVLLTFLFLYLYRNGYPGRTTTLLILTLVFLFPLLVALGVKGGGGDAWFALAGIGGRIFYSPAEVLYWYFELFPGEIDYLYGRSIGKLSWLMGWEYFSTPNYVGMYGVGSRLESVNANAAFLGNLNADFGMPGVLLGGILVGMLMQGIQVFLIRRPKTIAHLVVYSYLMIAFMRLNSTALPVVLASNGALLILLLPWVLLAGVQILRGSAMQVRTQ